MTRFKKFMSIIVSNMAILSLLNITHKNFQDNEEGSLANTAYRFECANFVA